MYGVLEEDASRFRDIVGEWEESYPFTTTVDKGEMERHVANLYVAARKPRPKHFVWAQNPTEYKAIVGGLLDAHTRSRYEYTQPQIEVEEAVRDLPWFAFRNLIGADDLASEVGLTTKAMDATFSEAPGSKEYASQSSYSYRTDHWYITNDLEQIASNLSSSAVRHATGFSGSGITGGVFSRQNTAVLVMWSLLIAKVGRALPPIMETALDALQETTRVGGLWTPFSGGVVLCENPTKLTINGRGQISNLTESAVEYPGGFKGYYINGVNVPEHVIETPEQITVDEIVGQRNQEIRRTMMERMGIDLFLQKANARLIKEDQAGKLWETNVLKDDQYRQRATRHNGYWAQMITRPEVYLEVENSTPEPDGTRRRFFLRVPARFKTPKAAKAWTFSQTNRTFSPAAET